MAHPLSDHIFMSYSRKDEKIMRRVAEFLRIRGFKLWVDNEVITPGTAIWIQEIQKAISRSKAVIVILSPASKRSKWVLQEITYAQILNKPIVPILARGEKSSAIPIILTLVHFADMRKNEDIGLEELSKTLWPYLDKAKDQDYESTKEREEQEKKAREESEKLERAQAKREASRQKDKGEIEKVTNREISKYPLAKKAQVRMVRGRGKGTRLVYQYAINHLLKKTCGNFIATLKSQVATNYIFSEKGESAPRINDFYEFITTSRPVERWLQEIEDGIYRMKRGKVPTELWMIIGGYGSGKSHIKNFLIRNGLSNIAFLELDIFSLLTSGQNAEPRIDDIFSFSLLRTRPYLEVAFISELEKKSPILIVGDDDQAVYHARNSSPDFLREKFYSGAYQVFQLPFCTRCPRVLVDATNAFIQNVIDRGGFKSRINRPFAPYLEGKEYENSIYPKIMSATTTNIACLSKLVVSEITKIPELDTREAHEMNYPCVLVVGKRQYLNALAKKLREIFTNVNFTEAQNIDYSILDAYELLLAQENSNLGWRILAEFEFSEDQLGDMLRASLDGIPFVRLLPQEFVEKHEDVVQILRSEQLSEDDRIKLVKLLGNEGNVVVKHFYPLEDKKEKEIDTNQPTILLSSFEGCKGLSAGHVFVVGLNDGVMPKIQDNQIDDIECCRFVVALTRTRKRCYLISNKWDYSPKEQKAFQRSTFISLIPKEYLDEKGYLKSKDIV